jgi:asparagine synthase (glutamine-hydrolysing)
MYRSIYKLPPGCLLSVLPDRAKSEQEFSPDPDGSQAVWRPVRYWSARTVAESGAANPFEGTEQEAIDQFEDLLGQAIRLRMISDVPLGAFLSGGIDSSLVSALMQRQSQKPVRTFTIGFHESQFNEAVHAKKVAQFLGTDHTELYVTSEQVLAVIPRLPTLYDEPFGDPSQIPTFLVSEMARRHVTVSLSGDGGDELFAGYNRYFWWRKIWNYFGWMPESLRLATAKVMTSVSTHGWDRSADLAAKLIPSISWPHAPGDKIHKLADILRFDSPEGMYRNLVSQWKQPENMVIGGCEPVTLLSDRRLWAKLPDFTRQMMYLDLVTYLPDDILTKVDRASMAVSLEARVPLLDHRVVEFAWQIPLSMKIKREGKGKWLLRQVLYKYVPKELIERPKMGFGIPIDSWLRGPLREWAEELLDERRLRDEVFFHPAPIREKWTEHLSGRRNWQYPLWNVLMFQAWLSSNDRTPASAVSHH